MKFQVRDGFVCRVSNRIDMGNGKIEVQESLSYPGQIIDLTAEQACSHGHQIEPRDEAAHAWHDGQVLKVADKAPLGLSPQQLQAITQQIVQQLLGAMPATSPLPAAT